MKIVDAMTSGTQPPSAILAMFDMKNAVSMVAKNAMVAAAASLFQCQTLNSRKPSMAVVISIVPTTDMPYAEAKRVDCPKPMTRTRTMASSPQLTAGM